MDIDRSDDVHGYLETVCVGDLLLKFLINHVCSVITLRSSILLLLGLYFGDALFDSEVRRRRVVDGRLWDE